jgi:hypothetical protein
MTKHSPRIYIYKITFEEVPYYYYGVKREKYFNQEYWGTPITHKWCWELYTPKKQILQVFPYTDEGWIEAQEIETRLIRPFYNTDKWCLNESCGGIISLNINRETGKRVGLKSKQNKTGVCGRSPEKMSEDGKKGGKIIYQLKLGVHGRTKKQMTENGKIGGSISGKNHFQNKTGCFSLTLEERLKVVEKTNSQKWMCLETGYITTSGPLTLYQKNRGIDTTKRVRIS